MRRYAVLALVLPALAAAGCGGGKKASSPLDEGLRYLPAAAPFAVAIDTDLQDGQYRAAGRLAGRFPFGNQLGLRLKGLFQRGGNVDFERDVKPLLGNPFVVGAPEARGFGGAGGGSDFVGAIEAKDGGKLKEIVGKEGAHKVGDKEGATLYQDASGETFAVKDDVLVVAGSRKLLEDALKRRNGGGGLSEGKFDSALASLPKPALVRTYFNVQALLGASPGGRQASQVKWIGALRSFGLTATAAEHAASVDFDLKASPAGLTDKDLPIAAGAAAPGVVRRAGELGLGLRDPGQLVRFALAAASSLEGGSFDAGRRQLESQLGVSIERDVVRQLTGQMSVNVSPAGRFAVRAELVDAAAFKRTLAKLAGRLRRLAGILGGGAIRRSGDLYELVRPGGTSVAFGVLKGVLVVASDPAGARRAAAQAPAAVPGANGSLAVGADAQKLAAAVLARLSAQIGPAGALGGQFFTAPLGDLTGTVSSSTSGLRGSFVLKID